MFMTVKGAVHLIIKPTYFFLLPVVLIIYLDWFATFEQFHWTANVSRLINNSSNRLTAGLHSAVFSGFWARDS